MRFIKILLSTLLIICGTHIAVAQMSDRAVIEYAKNAQAEGKTPEEISFGLAHKGVTRAQIERLQNEIQSKESTSVEKREGETQNRQRVSPITETQTERTKSSLAEKTKSYNGEQKKGYYREEKRFDANIEQGEYEQRQMDLLVAERMAMRARKKGSIVIFGHDLFDNNQLSFEPNLNIPTPENYKLGAGDEVIIDIWGDTEKTVREQISPEGSIIVEGIGPVVLNGLSIYEANNKVKNLFSRIHADLSSDYPNTFIKLGLGQIRSIRINIIGEATMSGTFTLPSLATVFHALYAAGGVNDVGTLRNIKVFRNGKLIEQVDVYKYLMTGDNTSDITLQDGDNIVIGTYDKLAVVSGQVKRPMHYEMSGDETVKTLLEYAGGYTSAAYKKNVNLTRRGDREHRVYTIYQEDIASFRIEDGDKIEVGTILNRYENRVVVRGAVYRPGEYALSNSLTNLGELLKIAEGVKGDAFLDRALLYRENPDLSTKVESVDIRKLLNGQIEDIELRKNDVLYIPSIYEIREGYKIMIHGEVKNPGTFPYVGDMSIEELVLQAGGMLESASVLRVDVSRRVKNPKSMVEAETEAIIYNLELKDGLIIDGPKNFTLEPFDEVFVRRSPGYVEQQNVYAIGEVMFEGAYSKVKNNERISSIIKRAGGLTSKAYVQGARLERTLNDDERRRVQSVLRLMKQSSGDNDSLSSAMLEMNSTYYVGIELDLALENPGSDYDLVLREGDRLIIPVYSNTVKISGAVMFPNTVTYSSKKNMNDYISQAGGYALRAKKGRTYIVYMNGMVARRRGGGKTQIKPGCEIIVPLKPAKNPTSLAEILSIASSTSSVAAMITSIVNMTK